MAQEIALGRIGAYANYVHGPHIELVVGAAVAGNSAAQLWAIGRPERPTLIVLWDQGNNVLYLCGELASQSAQRELTELINTSVRPRSIQIGRPYFKVRALTPSIENMPHTLFRDIALRELPTLLYALTSARRRRRRRYSLAADRSRVACEHSAEQYRAYSQRDTGDVAIRGTLLHTRVWLGRRSRTRACLLVYCRISERYALRHRHCHRAGIQRRGIATATAGQFVLEASQRGLVPYWECRADNIGLIRVAEKLGFELLAQERYWAGVF